MTLLVVVIVAAELETEFISRLEILVEADGHKESLYNHILFIFSRIFRNFVCQ